MTTTAKRIGCRDRARLCEPVNTGPSVWATIGRGGLELCHVEELQAGVSTDGALAGFSSARRGFGLKAPDKAPGNRPVPRKSGGKWGGNGGDMGGKWGGNRVCPPLP